VQAGKLLRAGMMPVGKQKTLGLRCGSTIPGAEGQKCQIAQCLTQYSLAGQHQSRRGLTRPALSDSFRT
jgi:hypothetical protein